jgi:phage tail sheath protein FI
VATGSIAARAIARGAWVAPANQALPDVVELTPALTRAAAERLREVQLNPLLQEPAGFVAVAADTLSVDADLRPLGVRRLMSLLRRVALLHGPGYAFEPNSGAVHRAIERRFGELLTRLHVLGAFAGATPEQAYQVRTVVDDRDLDAGRLVVELKVAPSRPLVFLTVRLVQTGDGTRVEGA